MRACRIVYAAGLWLAIHTAVPAQDCNLNGIVDATDIANCSGDPSCDDCNSNGVPDECDLVPQLTYGAAITINPAVTRPVCLVAADVNGAGGIDLVSGSLDSNLLEIWLGDGAGSFSSGGSVTVGDGPFDLVAAELNGQSGIDLACVNLLASSGTVSVALNNGSGGFSVSSLSLGGAKTGITAADFDGASGVDLAVVDRDSQEVSLLLNNGSGAFSVHATTLTTGDLPFRLVAFDYNDNGKADLAVANNDDNSITIFRNTFPASSGFVLATTLSPPGTGQYGIVTANVDSDDGDDLVIVNDTSNDLTVLLDNNQGTSFITRGPFDVGATPFSCVVADLNADGDLDLATANFNVNRATVLLNDGSESFYNPFASDWSVGTGPRYIVAADFDGNGVSDLATANRDGSTLTVRLGFMTVPFSADCQFNGEPDDCESDCVSPPFAFCRNVTRSAQTGCVASVSPQEVDDFSFDPDGSAVELSLSPAGPYGVGTTSVTLTVEDGCCQIDTCTATITVVDDQSPTINCPSDRTRGTNSGCTFVGSIGTATATDDCTSAGSISISNDAPSSFPPGLTAVTWTAADASGNLAVCTQDIVVVDDDSPSLACPTDRTLSTNLGCAYLGSIGAPTATDNCSLFEDMTVSSDAPTLFSLGSTDVTWMVTDESGNGDSCVQRVTIVDAESPIIACPSAVTLETNSSCAYFGSFGTATAVDNCSSAGDIAISNDAPFALPLGVTEITWTATDEAGNSDTCTQMVTVEDATPPNLNCPSSATFATNSGCLYNGSIGTASATDNCSLVSSITISSDAPTNFPLGTTTVTWTATDEAGNSSTCTQNVMVVDGEAPQVFCPADISFEVNAGCTYIGGFGTASASDACSSVAIDNDAPSAFPLGDTVVTWTATDQTGNVASCMQTVLVVDTTAPTISCPPPFTLPVNSGCSYVGTLGAPTVADNCTGIGAIVVTNDASPTLPLGVNEVTWTARDGEGNSSSCTQLITVEDTIPPSLACPPDFTVATNSGCTYVGSIGSPTASDNCSTVVVGNNVPFQFPLGDTVVTWTATDQAGNASSCSQVVTIIDEQPPMLVCPDDLAVSADVNCGFDGDLGQARATDNCSLPAQIVVSDNRPEQFPLGETVVIWTAADESGNSVTCEQRVTVEDTTPPELSCPSDRTRGTTFGCVYDGSLGDVVVTDNCTVTGAILVTNDAPAELDLGLNVVTWTAIDARGNVATCAQEILVVDEIPPEISCPSPRTRDVDAGCTFTGGVGQATANDNCSTAGELSIANDVSDPLPLGLNVVTWTATDAAGNVSTCTQEVVVVDSEPPTIVCGDAVVFEVNGGCAYTGPLEGQPAVSDNCSSAEQLVVGNDAPVQFPLGATLVTWVVADEAGNTTECTQVVTVLDRQLPSISCPDAVTLSANDRCSYVGTHGAATATDNCSAPEMITLGHDGPSAFPPGVTVVRWTASDEAGNVATCSQEVTVVDDESPFLQCPASFDAEPNADCIYDGPFGNPIIADNCSSVDDVVIASDAPETFPIGSTAVTWSATDAAGNLAICVQEVVVRDLIPPVLTCPSDLSLAANSGCLFVGDVPLPEVDDDCTEVGEIELTSDAPTALLLGGTVVTWTAVDASGNTSSCAVNVTVEDVEEPQITCPDNIVVACGGDEGVVVDFAATAVDGCAQELQVSYAPAPGTLFPAGESVVTCAARDASGNSMTCTFTVTVLCGGRQVPGDCNQDGALDISDPVCVLGFLFLGRPSKLPCGDGRGSDPSNGELYAWGGESLDLSSAVRALQFLFFGGDPHPLGSECVTLPGCPDRCP